MSHVIPFRSGPVRSIKQQQAFCSKSCRLQSHALFLNEHRRSRPTRSRLTTAAKEDGQEKGEKIVERKEDQAKTSKLVEGMKKGGIDQNTAQRILDTWEKTGATSTDALRKMLLGRSLKTIGVVLVQLLLDGGAAWGAYNSGKYAPISAACMSTCMGC